MFLKSHCQIKNNRKKHLHCKPICLLVLYVTQTANQMLLAIFFSFAWCAGNLRGYFGGSSAQQQEGENIFESVIVKPQNTSLGTWPLVPEAALISNQK